MIDTLQPFTDNFTMRWEVGGVPDFRLLKVPIDELSVIKTFLAVQNDINTFLQARAQRERDWQVASQQDAYSTSSGFDAASTSDYVRASARRMSKALDALHSGRDEAPSTVIAGSARTILIEVWGGTLVTSLAVNARYFASTDADAFEHQFNQILTSALRLVPSRGGASSVR